MDVLRGLYIKVKISWAFFLRTLPQRPLKTNGPLNKINIITMIMCTELVFFFLLYYMLYQSTAHLILLVLLLYNSYTIEENVK